MKKKPFAPLALGQAVFIRTVTHYYTGRVTRADAAWVILSEAAWIADTGRFADALRMGRFNEVEPYPDDGVIAISIGAIVDVAPWGHALPRVQCRLRSG